MGTISVRTKLAVFMCTESRNHTGGKALRHKVRRDQRRSPGEPATQENGMGMGNDRIE